MKKRQNVDLSSPSRRTFVGRAGIGAAALALGKVAVAPRVAAAAASPASTDIITKRIPKTGELIPAIGMGSFMTFDVLPGQSRGNLREVLKRFYAGGGRVVDTSPLYGDSEVNVGELSSGLGITNELLFTDKMWVTGEYLSDDSHGRRSLDQSMRRLWRNQIDVVQVHSLTNVEIMVPFLNEMKAQGRIRYVGVTHHDVHYFEPLAWWVENGPIDFVQVHYSIRTRDAEKRILAAAQERGIAVMLNMPLEKARLHKVVEGRRLPDFAAEIGATTWSQFFLKWAISHPAVTCALPATTDPEHMTENIGALRGPLPDASMRDRMVRYMESVPGFEQLDKMPWYPGKSFHGLVHLRT
ncbi:aldo/keto reductase [Paraburkholderia caribensis]|uniref:aldo/keto reductase n=1 Tax=Paraburkholderia caribensis TaxID=75105 RepID=UPI001CABD1A4|nr:aldo/keto reductase [Paraburkholderia caribensis]CAG9262347.1 Aldo/keto reductase [Paraburkholderia caribensis]